MKKIIGILTLALSLSFGAFAQKEKGSSVSFASSTKCGMCKKTIESNLGKEKGVSSVNVDLASNTVNVNFNPKKVTKEQIQHKITMIGYDANEMVADQKAHDSLPACCKKTSKPHFN